MKIFSLWSKVSLGLQLLIALVLGDAHVLRLDRKSTRLNSSPD